MKYLSKRGSIRPYGGPGEDCYWLSRSAKAGGPVDIIETQVEVEVEVLEKRSRDAFIRRTDGGFTGVRTYKKRRSAPEALLKGGQRTGALLA